MGRRATADRASDGNVLAGRFGDEPTATEGGDGEPTPRTVHRVGIHFLLLGAENSRGPRRSAPFSRSIGFGRRILFHPHTACAAHRLTSRRTDELGDKGTADVFTELVRQADKDLYFLESHIQA